MASLVQLQEHYGEWQEHLPESLQASALGKKLQAIAEPPERCPAVACSRRLRRDDTELVHFFVHF